MPGAEASETGYEASAPANRATRTAATGVWLQSSFLFPSRNKRTPAGQVPPGLYHQTVPGHAVLLGPHGEVAGRLHLAATPWSRVRGLIGRASLEPDEALLIEPCRRVHTFGMRFAIDAVFCDRAGRVLAVETLRPWRVSPFVRGAHMCIELPAGRAAESSIAAGTKLDLRRIV